MTNRRKPLQSVSMHIHASSAYGDHVTLTFDLLTSGSMHFWRSACTVCMWSLVLIAQAILLLECGHTDTLIRTTHALARVSIREYSPM